MKKNKKRFLGILIFVFSMLFNSIDTQAAHSHTIDCYKDSMIHVCSGNEKDGGGCYTIPIYHRHSAECYSSKCSNNYNKVISSITENGYCSTCGKLEYKIEFKCDLCQKVVSDIGCSTETCSNYLDTTSLYNNFPHGDISKDMAMALGGEIICGKTDGTIERYSKTCGKENGVYYDMNGNKSTPICNTIATNWKLENENQSGESFNSNVVVTFLDGHTENIVGKNNFDTIDKTKSHFNEPIMVYVDLLTSASGVKQSQTLVGYYTKDLGNDAVVNTISSNETKEIEQNKTNLDTVSNNKIKEEMNNTVNDLEETIQNKDDKNTNKENEENEDIMLISENPNIEDVNDNSYTINPIPITIAILCAITLIFVGINIFIKKIRNK